jgi:hypothetical protein
VRFVERFNPAARAREARPARALAIGLPENPPMDGIRPDRQSRTSARSC